MHSPTPTNAWNLLREMASIGATWRKTDKDATVWYRGARAAHWLLLPPLYRPRHVENLDWEESAVTEFLVHGPNQWRDSVQDPWATYALMRHHGLRTRLLDWTRSPLVAAFFAVYDPANEQDELPYDRSQEDAAVWIVDAVALNEAAGYGRTLYLPHSGSRYLPSCIRGASSPTRPPMDAQKPLAIEPPLSNSRMLAQQSSFTVHGESVITIDSAMRDGASDRIHKIIIPSDLKTSVLDLVYTLGISESTIYPDFDHLSQRINREYLTARPMPV